MLLKGLHAALEVCNELSGFCRVRHVHMAPRLDVVNLFALCPWSQTQAGI